MLTQMQDHILRQFDKATTPHQGCASLGDNVSAVVSHNFANSGSLYAMDAENRTIAKLTFDFQHGYCTLSVEDTPNDRVIFTTQGSIHYTDHDLINRVLSIWRDAVQRNTRLSQTSNSTPGQPDVSE